MTTNFLSKFFTRKPTRMVVDAASAQSLTIDLQGPIDGLASIQALTNELRKTVSALGIGDVDGHDYPIDFSSATIYIYGENADKLFEAVEPVLRKNKFGRGAKCKRIYGPVADPKSPEKDTVL